MLLAEYVDDVVMSQNTHAIKSRKDSLWSLVETLTFVFNHPNPTEHYLFENIPEINEEGIRKILSFYETGKLRFQEVLEEDVYKTKPRTSKRRIRSVNCYSSSELNLENIKNKRNRADNSAQEPIVQPDTEKNILAQLFRFGDCVPDAEFLKVLTELQTVSSNWTEKRVKTYWRNNRQKNT
ncbi:2962_t:CDS:2 [Cetraspora pellucida]|uniref:2962_t:CDS:1 n=1 Tax=Cetraspora pellucida TaxID=1433469 RepID=A0ACA9QFK9_9GLOM|nr:2962_t:CDS:2 [Cetraspora pellucida]